MDNISKEKSGQPCVGIIMLDTRFPRIKGDIGNPETFGFPVLYEVVKGASPERIVHQADRSLIQPFVEAGRFLINHGARIIATSCGFLALFHNELTHALGVPVFSSSLLQVHIAQAIIKQEQKIGIITASKSSLTPHHFAAIGIEQDSLEIVGMEGAEEFTAVFINGKRTLDEGKCGEEIAAAALQLKNMHVDIGAIILECTNMPPYTHIVHEVTGGLPVFDTVTMLNYAAAAINLRNPLR
jgi:Asp/Glu/hydantoin racemase